MKFGIYKHFKGGLYEVLYIGFHSETEEKLVIYRNTITEKVWVCPFSMFVEEVEYEGRTVKRFEFVK